MRDTNSSNRRPEAQRRLRRRTSLLAIAALAFTLPGCEAIKELTGSETPTAQRALSLKITPQTLPEGGGDVQVEATLTVGSAPESGVPVTFSTTAGSFLPGNTATTDGAGTARVTLRTTTSATVSANVNAAGVQVAASSSAQLLVGNDVVPDGNVVFEISFKPKPVELNNPVVIDVRATNPADGSAAEGTLRIEYGDGKKTTIENYKRRATVQHTYREVSIFNMVVSLTDPQGKLSRKSTSVRVVDATETTIELTAEAVEITARENLRFDVQLRRENNRRGAGRVTIDWGDRRSTNLGDVDGRYTIEHQYRDKGSYRVTARVEAPNGKTASASVRIRVLARLQIEGDLTASTQEARVGDSVSFTFTATRNDGNPTTGTAKANFSDGSGNEEYAVSNNIARFSHTFDSQGGYVVSVEFDDGDGHTARAQLRVNVQPEPIDDGGGGGGGGGGGASDAIDANSLVYLHSNAANWSKTSTVTSVSVSSSEICIRHTKAGGWPVRNGLEGNPWIVANVGGRWYAGTYEWLRPGQVCKALGVPRDYPSIARALGPHIKQSPLNSWVPKSGETVYFFVSTHARAGVRSSDERSNIVKVIWP